MREQDFPELDQVYLDSACMSLRPKSVIDKVKEYYTVYPVCPGRSNHSLSERATEELGDAREEVAEFIDASPENLVFTSGTTESINTVARGFSTGRVVLSDREHNSNLVPWQNSNKKMIEVETGENFIPRLDSRVEEGDLVSLVHVSNLDGYEIPMEEVSKVVEENNAFLMVDAAQSIPHRKVSVKNIQPDFMAFSGHKMCGPSGTGALYVSDRVKDELEPLKTGGGAVMNSTFDSFEPREFPQSMEPGLPNVAGLIGMGTAAEYLQEVGMDNIERHEEKLSEKIYRGIKEINGVENVGSRNPGV
ncbi:MAG: aminotransferase class V-fold PLP-dependent enzyme, partial [Candidatus Aenigmatarchaeota archaeon]